MYCRVSVRIDEATAKKGGGRREGVERVFRS